MPYMDSQTAIMEKYKDTSFASATTENFPQELITKRSHKSGETVALRQTQAETLHGHLHKLRITPRSSELPSTLLSQGGDVVFVVRGGMKYSIDNVYLQFQIQNTGPSDAGLLPVHWLFNEIEIKGNNGSTTIQTIESEEEAMHINQLSRQDFEGMRQTLGMTEGYDSDLVVRAGQTSRVLRHNLLSSFFRQGCINMHGWKQGFEFEFEFRQNPLLFGVASDLRVLNAVLVVENFSLDQRRRADLASRAGLETVRFLSSTLYESTQFLGEGISNNLTVKQIKGPVAAIKMAVRRSKVGGDYYRFEPLAGWEIENGDQDRLYSQRREEDEPHRFDDMSSHADGTMHRFQPQYWYVPSVDVKRVMETSAMIGGYTMKGDENFVYHTYGARVQPVLNVNVSAAPDSGRVMLKFRDPISGVTSIQTTPPMLFSSSSGEIENAIESAPSYRDGPGTVTVSGNFQSGIFTVTFTGYYYGTVFGPQMSADALIFESSLLQGNTFVSLNVTPAVIPTDPGFVAGNYDVVICALRYCEFTHRNGEIIEVHS